MRSAIWILSALVLLAAPSGAWAQTTGNGTTTGLGLTKDDFTIEFRSLEDGEWVLMNKTTFDTFFNRARCECGAEVQIRVFLKTPEAKRKLNGQTGTVKLRAGDMANCVCQGGACPAVPKCQDLGPEYALTSLINNPLNFIVPVRDLFPDASGNAAAVCDQETSQDLWVWIDGNDSGADPDLTDVNAKVQLDGRGPPTPTGLKAVGGNEALEVSWESLGQLPDLQGYQVLCARNGDLAPFPNVYRARFDSPGTCASGSTSGGDGGTSDAGRDAGTSDASSTAGALTHSGAAQDELSVNQSALGDVRGTPPPKLAALDPQFTCTDILTSQNNARIYRLQNGIPYVVGVVAIDKNGNPSQLTEVVLQSPTQTIDFYSGYRRAGGAAEGGCTLVAATPSRGQTGWLLLGLALVGLRFGLRRRSDRR